MYFCVNEFEIDVNDSIFSGNEQQKVSLDPCSQVVKSVRGIRRTDPKFSHVELPNVIKR